MTDHLLRFQSVVASASTTSGFITSQQMAKLGVPQQTVSRWRAKKLLHPMAKGIYRVHGTPYGFEEAIDLAVLLRSPDQVIGGTSALALWQLPGGVRGKPCLYGPYLTGGSRSPRIIHRRVTDLKSVDITSLNGTPLTTPLRSILDACPTMNERMIGAALTEGVRQGHFSYEDAAHRTGELSRRGKRGLGKVRNVLAHRLPDRLLANGYEEAAFKLIVDAGLVIPIPQFVVVVRGRSYRLDFAWPELRKLLECDSMLSHSTPEQLQSDLDRQNDLVGAGWTPIRWTTVNVFDEPERSLAHLARHIPRRDANSGGNHPPSG